jgi:cephalosporin hydroxylase
MRSELIGLPACEPNGQHWFWHGEQILALLDVHRPVVCVELGSHRGGSAIAVARVVRQWGGVVYGIDMWDGDVSVEDCARNVREAGVADTVWLERSRTDDAVRWWGDNHAVPQSHSTIDYLYIDADHTKEGCRSDLDLWWPYLRVGGLIAGDDYDDPRWGVTPAWDEFEADHGQQFERKATPGTDPACTRLIWGVKR